MEKQPKH